MCSSKAALIAISSLLGRAVSFNPSISFTSPLNTKIQSKFFAKSVNLRSSTSKNLFHLQQSLKMSSSPDNSEQEQEKHVLVPIAENSEEIETTCITDTLTRCGATVVVASVKPDGELMCKMSRGVKMVADITIEEAAKKEWDLIVLPGGMPGAAHLRDCKTLVKMLEKQSADNKKYGAVCAAPAVALAANNLLPKDGVATCYPAPNFRSAIENVVDDEVVVNGNCITSKGPGTSLKFALQLGEELFGKEKADEIAAQMLVTR